MPELPDVDHFCRAVLSRAEGQRIAQAEAIVPGIVQDLSSDALNRRIQGATISGVRRHGKHAFLLLDTDDALRPEGSDSR